MSIEKRSSKTNIPTNNTSTDEVRRKTPSRHSSGLTPAPSFVESNNSSNRTLETPFSLILELFRIIVRKLEDMEQSMSTEVARRKAQSGLISINEKSIRLPNKVQEVELPRMDLLLEKLQASSPARGVKQLKQGQSPAHAAYEELELKIMVGQQLKPLAMEVERLKAQIDEVQQQLRSSIEGQQDELMGIITALKDFAADRRANYRKG